ncbi:MAG TPA: response regulator [Candidatus Deferrimicrobium sp.]|nr:response regulator [Candidatus Deferrimicrobium sp.]
MDSKILIVDDQMGVRRLLYEAFKEEGFQVDMAASGQEAITKVKEVVPELILMDMKMPGMNGLEALKEIKKLNLDIAVIMMTAYGELEIVTQAMKLGVKEYITKPFDLNDLKLLVKRTLTADKAS